VPTENNLSQFVIWMREAGLNTTTCNISIVAFNSFLTWLKEKNLCPQTFSIGDSRMRTQQEDYMLIRSMGRVSEMMMIR